MGRLEINQLKLETKIENEVIDKLRALIDAHTIYMDYFASLKDGQARIEDRSSYLTTPCP